MAVKKKKKASGGVPEWVVTFGDMMSLLLCFFILLQMFSELKQEHEYQKVVTAIKEAFGYSGGIGVMPVDDPPLKSIIEQMELMAVRNYRDTVMSQNDAPGMDGPQVRVNTVREGIQFTIGGPSTFEPLSAEVKPAVKEEILRIVPMLAGRNNKIEIRGHAAAMYLPDDSEWADLDQLSYARAKNVMDILVEAGLDNRVFRLQAIGTREPVRPRAVDPNDAAENRRVEIILTEALVEDMNADAHFTDPDGARGGST